MPDSCLKHTRHLREFVENSRHPDPRRVGKGGPELRLLTLIVRDPLDPVDPVDPVDPLMSSQPMISRGASSQNRLWEVRCGAHFELDPSKT